MVEGAVVIGAALDCFDDKCGGPGRVTGNASAFGAKFSANPDRELGAALVGRLGAAAPHICHHSH